MHFGISVSPSRSGMPPSSGCSATSRGINERVAQMALSPVVDDIDPRPAIAGFVVPVHVDALKRGAETACDQVLVSLVPRQVHACHEIWHGDRHCERLSGVQQTSII